MKQWTKHEEQTDRVLQATVHTHPCLIPHDEIAENTTLAGLASRFTVTPAS
jgi:hypothetical protein